MTDRALTRLLLAVAVAGGWLALAVAPATAACHAFEVSAEPGTVAEGGVVQVTVSRDADVAPSSIDVETVDGTARGGADYTAVPRRTINFADGTEQTFPVQTSDDTDREAAETFKIHLSNPGGCAVNPNFQVGPDATVTIGASDDTGSPTTAGGGAGTTSGRPGTTRLTPSSTAPQDAALGSTTAPPTLPPLAGETDTTFGVSTTRQGEIALAEEDDGGLGLAVVIIALAVAAFLGGAGWWTWRRRMVTPPDAM